MSYGKVHESVEALAAPAGRRETFKRGERVLITADGFEPLSSYPMEESRLWKCQPRDRSRLTASDSGSPVPLISLATRYPL